MSRFGSEKVPGFVYIFSKSYLQQPLKLPQFKRFTMARNGALAVLSLDGCMAVDIETSALQTERKQRP